MARPDCEIHIGSGDLMLILIGTLIVAAILRVLR